MNSHPNLDAIPDESSSMVTKMARIAIITFVLSCIYGISILVFYFVQNAWQHLGLLGLTLLDSILSLLALNQARRNRPCISAHIILGIGFIFYPFSVFFWKGASLIFALTFLVFINNLAQLIIQRQRRFWLFLASLAASAVPFVLDLIWLPWQRYDVTQWQPTSIFVYMLPVTSVIVVAWYLVSAYKSIKSISLRLTVALAIGGLVVATLMGSASLVVGTVNSRNQVLNQLAIVADLKQDQITAWLRSIQAELDVLFIGDEELNQIRALINNDLDPERRRAVITVLTNRLTRIAEHTGRYAEILLLNPQGKVLVSTDKNSIGKDLSGEEFLRRSLLENNGIGTSYRIERDQVSFIITRPLTGESRQVFGVVVARINHQQLDEIVSGKEIGSSRVTYIVSENYELLTPLNNYSIGDRVISIGIINAVRQNRLTGIHTNACGVRVAGVYQWIPSLRAALITEIDRAEIMHMSLPFVFINIGVAIITTLLGVILSLWISRGISSRLKEFTGIADRMAQGETDLSVPVKHEDEIGILARVFNSMTAQLNRSVLELEKRVDERTQGLLAAAEVSRASTSELDPVKLIPQVVNLVHDYFNLYYVGLFLVEDRAEGSYAVLSAGTGKAGQEMVAQGWRLPIGGGSMIGQCISTGALRVNQSEQDFVVRFDNPYLPDTQSELALPLHVGPRIIGAMTIQSDKPAAFDETIITLFQNMADQVAIVIENARLFSETQSALERAESIQQRYQVQTWRQYMMEQTVQGLELNGGHFISLSDDLLPEIEQVLSAGQVVIDDEGVLSVPIIHSGRVVGALGFDKADKEESWNDEQIGLVQELADQLALAAENQRLLNETQTLAARERLTREVTEQIRSSLDVNTILHTAVREIGQAMGLEDMTIKLREI